MGATTGTGLHPALTFDVLLYEEDDHWIAHCLQLDLAEAGRTPEEAEDALAGVVGHHVEWAIADDDLEHLLHAAPVDVWRLFLAAEPLGLREVPISVPTVATPAAHPMLKLHKAAAMRHLPA